MRQRFRFQGFDPRGVGSSASRQYNSHDNDVLRADPQGTDTQPGRAHRGDREADVRRCVDKMGIEFPANVGTVNVAATSTGYARRLGEQAPSGYRTER